MNRQQLNKKALGLPADPGVYLMKNAGGDIIYVGKAKALKKRVVQYFRAGAVHDIKVERMVENTADFDYIVTRSEFEALVLECSLIKQHRPKYNILLKDDKGYSYIRISADDIPVISAEKRMADDGAQYLGPFTSSFAVTNAVEEARRIFRLPDCGRAFPAAQTSRRPCLNHFIGRCSAPCAGKIGLEEYRESVSQAVAFLKGGSAATRKDMEAQMLEAAETLDFERAARLRDKIAAIDKIRAKQAVICSGVGRADVFALVLGAGKPGEKSGKACFAVLRFTEGKLTDSENFVIDSPSDSAAAAGELLRGYYLLRTGGIPPKIVYDGDVEDKELLEQWLSASAGRRVRILRPARGALAGAAELCRSNAAEKLAGSTGRTAREAAALDELARLLGLPSPPAVIEAYDISHTSGSQNVAGMVVFKDGSPHKAAYKRFIIKGFSGQDDCASMAEVVARRLQRYESEKGQNDGFGRLPDLILLDGGSGQLSAVLPALKSTGLDIPVFGMVKDSRHKTRAIAADSGEIALGAQRRAYTLVSQIQEEAHRFAVAFHRSRRKAAALAGTLTNIEGVGPAKARALLKHFKTMKALENAGEAQLAEAPGIGKKLAAVIYTALHSA